MFIEEKIDQREHPLTDWERKTDALGSVLAEQHIVSGDEMRRALEDMPPKDYEDLSYYDRWVVAIETILAEKQLLHPEEITSKAKEISNSWE